MKVITWNVNNRLGVVSQQVQVLGQREPDVVTLQDVNGNAVSRYPARAVKPCASAPGIWRVPCFGAWEVGQC